MKKIADSRTASRVKRHERLRLKVAGTEARPRLAIFRSLSHIYAQVIDDTSGSTLAAASSLEASLKGATGTKVDDAKAVGKLVAERAKEKGVSEVVFDRGSYLYHGRIKALGDAAREGGLKF